MGVFISDKCNAKPIEVPKHQSHWRKTLAGTYRITSSCLSCALLLQEVFCLYSGRESEGTEQAEQAEEGNGREAHCGCTYECCYEVGRNGAGWLG